MYFDPRPAVTDPTVARGVYETMPAVRGSKHREM